MMPESKTYGNLDYKAPMHIVKLFQLPSFLPWELLAGLAPGELLDYTDSLLITIVKPTNIQIIMP